MGALAVGGAFESVPVFAEENCRWFAMCARLLWGSVRICGGFSRKLPLICSVRALAVEIWRCTGLLTTTWSPCNRAVKKDYASHYDSTLQNLTVASRDSWLPGFWKKLAASNICRRHGGGPETASLEIPLDFWKSHGSRIHSVHCALFVVI